MTREILRGHAVVVARRPWQTFGDAHVAPLDLDHRADPLRPVTDMSKTLTKRASKARNDSLFVVRKSPLHGKGLFARRPIAEDTVIGVYEGPRVEDGDEDGDHVLWVEEEDGAVYGIDGENELRYVNHSVDPNVVFEEAELVALRDIEPGEELLHDYGDDWADV